MRAYSQVDIIGKEIEKYHKTKKSFIDRLFSFLERKQDFYLITIFVPDWVLVRTQHYCDVLSEYTEEEFTVYHFLNAIIRDYLTYFDQDKNRKKCYELLESYHVKKRETVVVNHLTNQTYSFYTDKDRKLNYPHLNAKAF